MVLENVYVIARSASGRATLQHRLLDRQTRFTRCGVDTQPWSRAFQQDPLGPLLCLRCGH